MSSRRLLLAEAESLASRLLEELSLRLPRLGRLLLERNLLVMIRCCGRLSRLSGLTIAGQMMCCDGWLSIRNRAWWKTLRGLVANTRAVATVHRASRARVVPHTRSAGASKVIQFAQPLVQVFQYVCCLSLVSLTPASGG